MLFLSSSLSFLYFYFLQVPVVNDVLEHEQGIDDFQPEEKKVTEERAENEIGSAEKQSSLIDWLVAALYENGSEELDVRDVKFILIYILLSPNLHSSLFKL